jgi:hypothetical protein
MVLLSGWSRDRQAELVGCHGHPVVVGDDPGQVSAELLGGREVDRVQGPELGRQHRPGSVQDRWFPPARYPGVRFGRSAMSTLPHRRVRHARSLGPLGALAEADGNRTRLSRVAAHTGFEDENSSANVGIDSNAAGQRRAPFNIGANLALLNNGSNGDSVPATVPTLEPQRLHYDG